MLTFSLASILTFFLSSILAFSGVGTARPCPLRSGARGWGQAVPSDPALAVEVRQCPLRSGARSWSRQCALRSGARGWGPAVHTEIWSSRLRPGSAHWDLELEVEVRQCPLTSGVRGRGPAVPTEIWHSQLRSGRPTDIWSSPLSKEGGGRKEKVTLIKSRDPHLAGGEQPMGGCNPSQKFQIWPKDSANWEWGMKSISPSFSHIFRVRKKIGICNRWHSKHPRVESHAEPTQRLEACALWTLKSIMNFWQLQTQT